VRSVLINRRNFQQFVAVLLLSSAGCSSNGDRVLEETFERLYTIQPTTDISVQNRDGAILVYGSNTNEMQLHARIKAYSRARLKQIKIDVSAQPTSISISTRLPPKPKWALFDRSGTVEYTIVVPSTANLAAVHLDAGEVLVDGMRGKSVRAWLGDGRIFTHNCFSNVDLALQRGNLTISYDWWEDGTFSAQANIAQGNAWAFLPLDAAFHLVAEIRYGKIGNDFDNPAVARPTLAGAAKIDTLIHGGGTARIEVRTMNGDIHVVATNP
jgi:hypothetical protein